MQGQSSGKAYQRCCCITWDLRKAPEVASRRGSGEVKVRPIHGPGLQGASGLGKEFGKKKKVIAIVCKYWDGGRRGLKGAFTNWVALEETELI